MTRRLVRFRDFSISAGQRLEYRMIGPRPDRAPTIVMLHEGLGCVGMWGDFPDKLAAATGAGVFVYSRAGYGQSSPVTLPRPLSYMHEEARETLPRLLVGDRLPARASARPQRRRLDRDDLCRHHPGSSRARAHADRAAFLCRGPEHHLDRGGEDRLCANRSARASSRAGTRIPTTPSAAGTTPGSIREFREWDITTELAYIRVPVLIVQGAGRPIRNGEADRGRAGGMLLPGRCRAARRRETFAAARSARRDAQSRIGFRQPITARSRRRRDRR